MHFDSSMGILFYICDNLIIRENLSTKEQLIYDHSVSQIEIIVINPEYSLLYSI